MQSKDDSAFNQQTSLNGKSTPGKTTATSEQLSALGTESTPELVELETPDSATEAGATSEPWYKKPSKWILGIFVVGAIVAGGWGLRWWHYASTRCCYMKVEDGKFLYESKLRSNSYGYPATPVECHATGGFQRQSDPCGGGFNQRESIQGGGMEDPSARGESAKLKTNSPTHGGGN
ncbi:hypothetical protein J5X98_17960 [Leptothermofonsia sichuanensis E412]|nr:hypothetical protein [Leptothermofonsia sichuanensis]QZZ19272.1 hypothetical protein J5X98_17960 [Leptothermofonsia sichuanensis E412]